MHADTSSVKRRTEESIWISAVRVVNRPAKDVSMGGRTMPVAIQGTFSQREQYALGQHLYDESSAACTGAPFAPQPPTVAEALERDSS